MARFRRECMDELEEMLEHLAKELPRLQPGSVNMPVVNQLFRVTHTIKGSAGLVQLLGISRVAHAMEEILRRLRDERMIPAQETLDALYEGQMMLTCLRTEVLASGTELTDVAQLALKIEGLALDMLSRPESEPPRSDTPSTPDEQVDMSSPERLDTDANSDTVRVPLPRLDRIANLVGELTTERNRLMKLGETFRQEELLAVASAISRITRELQSNVMATRMVPIERLFTRFPSLVRLIARDLDKRIELELEGTETEVDKRLVEEMYDPLVHLLRNSVDHGIEHPSERGAVGKNLIGRLRLFASHHNGHLIIELRDDGRGIDPDRVRQAAVRKGLLSREEAHSLGDKQAVELIFLPGFSTAERVTETSGRGVGMDAVRESVTSLRGRIEISSEVGAGTLIRLILPLTLATQQVLLVQVAERVYGLPLQRVEETLLLCPDQVQQLQHQDVLLLRGKVLPLISLRKGLGLSGEQELSKCLVVVCNSAASGRFGLLVEGLLHKQEVVMKALSDYIGSIQGVEGAAVLADGSVMLVLDPDAFGWGGAAFRSAWKGSA